LSETNTKNPNDVGSPEYTALQKAKIQLMSTPDSAFFATVCFSLRHIFDDRVSTAATDGRVIRFNPTFFMKLTPPEQVFLLLHETLHVAYLHILRVQPGMNKSKANAAMDYVINLQLTDRNFKMPKCGLLDSQYKGMSWEEVYKLLPDDQSPSWDDLDPMEREGTGAEQEALAQEVQDILVRASIQSRMAGDKPGTIPGEIQIFIDKILNPKLPWQKLLMKYFRSFDKSDYSFKKPNRRFFPKWHLPTLWGESLMDLVVAVDTSGSVSDSDFNTFVSEVHTILRMMKPSKITFIQFDTGIRHVNEVRSVKELLSLKFTGRGGTDVNEVLEWANKNKPQLLMFFTDGEFRAPDISVKNSDVLWLIHNNKKFSAPFGKTIHYEI
jgi:predicted metal-dependent peptidase